MSDYVRLLHKSNEREAEKNILRDTSTRTCVISDSRSDFVRHKFQITEAAEWEATARRLLAERDAAVARADALVADARCPAVQPQRRCV